MWFNKQHLTKLTDEEYLKKVNEFLPEEIQALPDFSEERLSKLLPTLRERTEALGEISIAARAGEYDFAFKDPSVSPELLRWKNDSSVEAVLPRFKKVLELLDTADFSSPDTIKASLWDYVEAEGKGEVLWPLRVALTGLERSPDPFTVAYIIGPVDTKRRIEQACVKIGG